MLLFSKKLLDEKIFKTSFPIKKIIFIFVARHLFPSKETWPPRNGFLPFSQKIQLFLKNPLSNKIFRTLFVIKKVILIFATRLLSPKSRQMCTENSFSRFSRKVLFFSKILLNKKIFSISFLIKKGYIYFWCKMTLYRSHSDRAFVFANKVRVRGDEDPFNPSTFRNIALLMHFLRQRFFISYEYVFLFRKIAFQRPGFIDLEIVKVPKLNF